MRMLKPGTSNRWIHVAAVFFIIICLIAAYIFFCQERVLSTCRADLDNDGVVDSLAIAGKPFGKFGEYLVIRVSGEVFRYDMRELNPWKVQTADVDGDGRQEISISVFKSARYHPVEAKRPFIYDWSEDGIAPKWLGSRLSRPFEDYIFADIDDDGMDELISIEILQDGSKAVNSYKWKGFGFEGMGESEAFDDVRSISADMPAGMPVKDKGNKITADVTTDGQKVQVVLAYQDGKLICRQKEN